jgi:Bacterial Ig-like domain (group 2)
MTRFARLAPLLLLAACADRIPTSVTPPPDLGDATRLECRADVAARTVACTSAAPHLPNGVSAAVLGGQGLNVRVLNTAVAYDSVTFSTRVTLENLVAQALGTEDGFTPSAEGVRVFFGVAPEVTLGSGTVTVANADGQGFFMEAEQDFFQYDGILAPGDTTPAKEWRFDMPPSVEGFTFEVYVAARVAHEVGWIGVSPPMPSVGVGEAMHLAATVHGVSGRPLPGQIVAWSSSDPSVVAVTPDGTVTGMKIGFATVTAESNGRTGRAVVHVGASTGDGVPPTVRDFSFSPARVDADGVDSVTVTVRVADPGAGVQSMGMSFASPTAQHGHTCYALEPVSGTREDGVFQCRLAVRTFSEGGVWRVRNLTVSDQAGNSRMAAAQHLDDAGVSTSLYVRSAAPDVAAPALVSFAFAPDSVVAGAADSVAVEMGVTDAGVGVMQAGLRIVSPSGTQVVYCTTVAPAAGTVHDGTYACRLAIPAGAEAGDWRVETVSVMDSVNNSRTLHTRLLAEAGFPTRLHVTSPGADVTPPVLAGLSFTPGSVAADGVDSVTVTMRLTDAGVGVERAVVSFISPSGSTSTACHALEPVSGTRGDGVFSCRLAVPAGAETGTWAIYYLQAYDRVNNFFTLTRATVEAAGFPATLTVH